MPAPSISIQPSPLHTFAALAAAHKAGDVYLGGRLGKREVVRAEADARILAEHSAGEGLERSLEVAHGDVLVNDKSLELMEHRRMRCIDRIGTINSSGETTRIGGFPARSIACT